MEVVLGMWKKASCCGARGQHIYFVSHSLPLLSLLHFKMHVLVVTLFREICSMYGTWRVKKLYFLHHQENWHILSFPKAQYSSLRLYLKWRERWVQGSRNYVFHNSFTGCVSYSCIKDSFNHRHMPSGFNQSPTLLMCWLYIVRYLWSDHSKKGE